jgi:hypothetical protein
LLMLLLRIKVNSYDVALLWNIIYHFSFPTGMDGFVSSV